MTRKPFFIKRKINIIRWDQLLFTLFINVALSLGILVLLSVYAVFMGRANKEFSTIPIEIDTGLLVFKTSDLQNGDGGWREIINTYADFYESTNLSQVKTIIVQNNSFLTVGDEFGPLLKDLNHEHLGVVESVDEVCERIIEIRKAIIISYNDIAPRVAFLCNSETNYYAALKSNLDIRPRIINVIGDIFTKIFKLS